MSPSPLLPRLERGRRALHAIGPAMGVALATCVVVPPVMYQVAHVGLPFTDVGTYVRPMWNLVGMGRMVVYSDGTSDFFQDQHFEPFLFLLVPLVRLFGTMGYITAITAALIASAAYVSLFTAAVCRSRWVGALPLYRWFTRAVKP